MKKIMALMVGLFALVSSSAFAADVNAIKVGVVDLPMILQESPQIAAINKKLDDQFKSQQNEIIKAQNELRTEAQKLAPNAVDKLSAAQKKQIQQKITKEQKNFQTLVVKYQEDISKAQANAMKQLMDQINNTVGKIAKQQNIDIVLLKQAVVYAGSEVDLTQQVMQALPKK